MKTNNNNCVSLTALIIGVLLMAMPIPLSGAPVQYDGAEASALIDSPEEAFEAVVADIGNRPVDELGIFVSREILPEGSVITNWKGSFHTLTQARWFVLIDDHPGANWEHPCRYVFVDPGTGESQFLDATSPPDMLRDMIRFQGPDPFDGENLKGSPLNQVDRQTLSPDHLWAVILSGGYDTDNNHVRYWNDCSEIYKTLVNVYGYMDSHIIVAISDGLNPAVDQSNGENSDPDLDGDGDDDIMYPCQYADVNSIFTNLAATLTPMDTLFIFTTDHGSGSVAVPGQPACMNLWNTEEMWDYQFAGMLEPIDCREMIITMEPCFSGGFINDVIGMSSTVPRVITTAANDMEYSWAMEPDYVYDTYVFHWTAAVRWMDAYGVPVDADANGDTKITMDEAYNYALSMDEDDEHPQYGEWPVGFGSTITLAGPRLTSEGEIRLDSAGYKCGDTVNIAVDDLDCTGTVQVYIRSNAETTPETVTLTETDTAHFEGSIATATGVPSPDGVLQVSTADLITATYNDADNGTGSPAIATDTATVDGLPPGPVTGLTVDWWGVISVTLIDEHFATDPDWTITHTAGTAWTYSAANQRMENTFGYPNSGFLDSPAVDCTGLTGTTLSFWHFWQANYAGAVQDGYVLGSIDGGLSWPYLVDEFHHNDPATEIAVKNYAIPWADGHDQVRIRFDIYNDDDWFWRIDDVLIAGGGGSTAEHNLLNWTLSADDDAGADDVAQYNIYRSDISTGPWDATHLVTTVPAGTDTYTDSNHGELDGIIWWYVVRAEDVWGNEDKNTLAIPEVPLCNMAPSPPTAPLPSNGEGGVQLNATLSVRAMDPNGDCMIVEFYDASGPTLIGTVANVSDGSRASVVWESLTPLTALSWYATASDGEFTTQSLTWSFTTLDIFPPAPPSGLAVEWTGSGTDLLLNESFSGSEFPPIGWTEYGPSSQWWLSDTAFAEGEQPEAVFGWVEAVDTWRLIVGPFDLSRASNLTLRWMNYYTDYGEGATVKIQTSSDGYEWHDTGWKIDSGNGNVGPAEEVLELTTPDTASPTFNLAFTVEGDAYQLDYWYIDDVLLTCQGNHTTDDNLLTWSLSPDDGAGADDVAHYNIYRSETQTGPWDAAHLITTVPEGTSNFIDWGRGAPDGINWWYVVRAQDLTGNEESNTDSVPESRPSPGPYAIDLAGMQANSWVLVSFPSGLEGAIENLLVDSATGDGQTTWSVAKWYDICDPGDPWKTYRVGGTANDMPAASNRMGFWLYLTANGGDQLLTLSSFAETPNLTAINLYTGWNLVGYPSETGRTVASSFWGTSADRVDAFDAASQYMISILAPTDLMEPGKGYWVHVCVDSVWVVDW